MSAVEYEPVIGLEIHVQLATATKMFCGCELSFGEPPNTRTCPVCLGLPGSLPVANARAVHFGLMIGLALHSDLAPRSIFHRKNYFYPDLPKGYQISQYDEPLCRGGRLGEVRIHRVHLEEDAAKLVHAGSSGRIHGSEASVVDFNRGGTPLAEIVTEPDLRSSEQAGEWLRLLRATMRQLGVSDVNMEEGSLRCDANISLRPVGAEELGVKTELKNMNSFRFIERGIRAEIARQEAILRSGGRVEQETLHFDPSSERIASLRSKEEAHDYRYFPEPDLVPVAVTAEMRDGARAALPELPAERAERLQREVALSAESARLFAFRSELGDYFEAALAASVPADAASSTSAASSTPAISASSPTPDSLGTPVTPAPSTPSAPPSPSAPSSPSPATPVTPAPSTPSAPPSPSAPSSPSPATPVTPAPSAPPSPSLGTPVTPATSASAIPPQALANWIAGDLLARLPDGQDPRESLVEPAALAALVGLVASKRISVGAGRRVLDRLIAEGGDPLRIVEAEGLAAMDGDDELAAIVASALAAHPEAAANVRAGNAKAIGPIVGHVMRETKGRADGGAVTRLVHTQLGL